VIRRVSEIPPQPSANMRGGMGIGQVQAWFEPTAFSTKLAAFNLMTLDDGVSIGEHRHEGSEEVYLVLEGRARITDDGQAAELGPGDALLTCDGHSHSLFNPGPGPLTFLAVLSKK